MEIDTSPAPTLQQWLLDTSIPPSVVLDRLAELANYGLGSALHAAQNEFTDVQLTRSGSWTASRRYSYSFGYGHNAAGRNAEVWLLKQGSKSTLMGRCPSCNGGGSCSHLFDLVVNAVREIRPDVDQLLDNQHEVQKRTLSSEAVSFLDRATATSSAPALSGPSASGEKLLFYRLVSDKRGLFTRLALHLGTVLKNGSISSRSQSLDWSVLLPMTKSAPDTQSVPSYRSAYSYDAPDPVQQHLRLCATDQDKRLAKELFLQGGLPPVSDLPITNCDLLHSVKALCAEGRFLLEEDYQRSLTFGAPKTGVLAWKRGNQGGWTLGIQCAAEVGIIPSSPPMYVDKSSGEIGEITISLSSREIALVGLAKALSDRDVEVIRNHPQAGSWLANLPELPLVVVEFAGVATPRPSVVLDWRYDFDVRSSPYSGSVRHSDKGEAVARLEFLYDGLLPREGSPDELVRIDGERTIVYSRDAAAELQARELVCQNTAWAQGTEGMFVIHRGSFKVARTQAKIQDYQQQVVTRMHQLGWKVRMNEDWPQRRVELDSLHFASKELGNGWFGYDVSTQVNGAHIDMLQLLKVALTNKRLLADIARADDKQSFPVLSPEGYEIRVPVVRLKRLLPFFLTITTDTVTGVAKLRRIDFGVLEDARNSENDVIDGSTGLLDIARQLSDFVPMLPLHTRNSLSLQAREYQEYGAAWCDVRRRLGFGAIIGDEYAVGKTLQTILTLFNAAHEPQATQPCCLIVVTKTLFFEGRWQEDVQKFLPGMRLAEVYGAKQIARIQTLAGLHAVLTTYDTVVDQIDAFQSITWNVIACDEGHKLNNSATQAHKAIAALQARQKLIITGSPMQNGAREMWALLNLTVPGLLKDRTWFNQTFPKVKLVDADMQLLETSTEAQLGNTARLQALGKIVSPFFLRRTNKDLGRQLPPVQVIDRHVVMEQDQADVYEAVRASGRREAIDAVQAKGLNHSRLEVLTQINRLRQVCCDPSIVSMGGQRSLVASSTKRVAILQICSELVKDGRKIVITSEWNRLLDNIAMDLKQDGIEVVFVTGDLTGLKRKQAQEQFRTGAASVMLIQLTLAEGIELPEGDAIIICEPWWNRKKEEQAIARLRRDERDKHISVIRLMVVGSVENGVVRVAQSKLDDIEAVQMGHAAATGGLSMDDIDEFFRPLEKSALAQA